MDTAGLLTALLDAANRGDLDAATAFVDPQFEGVVPSTMSAEPDVYNGPEGLRRYLESFWEVVDGLRIELDEVEVHGEWIVASAHARGSGRASGLPIDNPVAMAFKSSEGLVTHLYAYPDMDAARAGSPGGNG